MGGGGGQVSICPHGATAPTSVVEPEEEPGSPVQPLAAMSRAESSPICQQRRVTGFAPWIPTGHPPAGSESLNKPGIPPASLPPPRHLPPHQQSSLT